MTTTNHALTGALIATVIKQPYLAIPLAFLSHFVCDALPHFEAGFTFGKKSMYIYLFFDGLCAALFALFLLFKGVDYPLLLAVSGFAAMSPDLTWLYYGLTDRLEDHKKFGRIALFHEKIQWSATRWGIVPEVFWAALMVTLILKLQ